MKRLLLCLSLFWTSPALALEAGVVAVADLAAERQVEALRLLERLIECKTVHDPPLANAEHPEFRRMTQVLREAAAAEGFDFADHGAVVIVGWGEGDDRLGLITHGDVQPADASKWAQDPYTLDRESEPGRLVGRGTEDDKGPIALALHAMAAVQDSGREPRRRVEIIVSYTEESDWTPFRDFLKSYEMPELNVALDAEYPVVAGENGWCMVHYGHRLAAPAGFENELLSLTGGAFFSQVPEDAVAHIGRPTASLVAALKARSRPGVTFTVRPQSDGSLRVIARGKAAHSSKPAEGVNAIAWLVDVLMEVGIEHGPAVPVLRFLHEMVGTGYLAERFPGVAYEHPFMGKLTLNLSTVTDDGVMHVANINLRRPAGPSDAEFESLLRTALADYGRVHGEADSLGFYISEAYLADDAPHVPVLLDVFEHFTGIANPQPISIGGGTHARLVPSGVNFGPAMPGEEYTGHSEHEFITVEQFGLNLRMYAAMIAALATASP